MACVACVATAWHGLHPGMAAPATAARHWDGGRGRPAEAPCLREVVSPFLTPKTLPNLPHLSPYTLRRAPCLRCSHHERHVGHCFSHTTTVLSVVWSHARWWRTKSTASFSSLTDIICQIFLAAQMRMAHEVSGWRGCIPMQMFPQSWQPRPTYRSSPSLRATGVGCRTCSKTPGGQPGFKV